jgi:hypothetical protein
MVAFLVGVPGESRYRRGERDTAEGRVWRLRGLGEFPFFMVHLALPLSLRQAVIFFMHSIIYACMQISTLHTPRLRVFQNFVSQTPQAFSLSLCFLELPSFNLLVRFILALFCTYSQTHFLD